MKTRNLIKSLGGTALVAAVLAFSTPANADPVTFVFDCTISGAAPGTEVCDGGPDVVQLTIAETSTDGVLSLSILRLFPSGDPPIPADDAMTLDAIHLNYVGLYGDNGDGGVPFDAGGPGPNDDTNYLEFSFGIGFDPLTVIPVANNDSVALNYKGFDVQLCDTGVGQCNSVPVTFTDTIFGYMRSGNGFVLTPELFDGLTEDTTPGGSTGFDQGRYFDDCVLVPAHLRAAIKVVPATSPVTDVCSNSENAVGYGPYYGSLAERPPQVPEPATLGLLGIGLFGMGLMRRRRKV